jgi:hypothetical protein
MFTPANGTLSQLTKNINMKAREGNVTPRHSLIMPFNPRLKCFTKYPPRNVPPPPAGTAAKPEKVNKGYHNNGVKI